MVKLPERKWIAEQVELVREARRKQGHALTPLQEGIVSAIASWDPRREPASAKVLAAIQSAIHDVGRWSEQKEWRISTWFANEITKTKRDQADWYLVAVECDGQRLSCRCPSLEGAYAFMRLYQTIIIDQFYSVGPPWADTNVYKS